MSSDSESLSLLPPRKHKKLSYSTGSSSLSESRKHKKLSDSGSSLQSSKHRNSTDELLQVVQTNHSKKIKQSDDTNAISDPIEMYRNIGRKVTCVLDLFGLQHDRGDKISSDLTKDVIECHLHLYNGILDFVLSLRDELDTISTDRLSKIISAIMKGMSDTQSMAFSSVKHKGLKYVPLNMHSKNNALDPPIPEVEDKSMQGIAHPQLAHWLCPHNKLHIFDSDPEDGMEKLQSGKIKMAAMSWPTGFYEHGIYDPQDKTKGLFRNHIITQFYAHLYIGPLAVMSESTSSKASKQARNHAFGLSSVTKHIITIVHIIMYFTLSQAQNWTSEIGTMNLEELFWSIIDMLDDDEDPWVKDTMAWWMACIGVKTKALTKKPENEDNDNEENDIADIKAQRLARRSAMKTKVAGASNAVIQGQGPARKKPAAPLPPKVKCRSGHLDTYEESEDEDESRPLPLKTKHPQLVTTPPPPKTKHTQLVESDDDIEDVKAPPIKKKTVPPPKAKRPQLIESDDNTEDVEAPPIKKTMDVEDVEAPPVKKTMVPPLKTKCTQLIESDEDVDDVKAPPVKKKLVPTPSLPMLKCVQPVKAPEEPAYEAPPNKETPVPSRPESPLPKLTEDESSGALFEPEPLPKKKGKKAAKVQCVPMKWNPTHQKRPNGF
ncbi:uncharacterized protein BJ212DRAFT_1480623 [Suillus subaureus]|uniref:Uncharacterized protein n=1 Tax=Suillus subaureus TaxID=48587 RepID=A0A9P7JDH6_9AGAM|nr:uncharacterized protein BJ212DRAFT_1480623 [Suillus subaureus]KAG1816766.1 hypothetical protein BJ212DRAFT_1480623 [Suillus subaureus]